ncbi:regulatory protein, luxR family [Epilithonimonas mollis]|uniref:Regulatory protein, luxR family n=2 Tax=Epilithonimonas mollis TaxID=216903 RepID=A0A1M6SMV9_9FLAO|nr:regulatory protein, luxR family [Epilithonimonas mollis]
MLFFNALYIAQDIQNKGMPFLKTYFPNDYGNQGKIWEIHSAESGLVYMASDGGLLEFDGQKWNRLRDYKGHTRSLHISNDSTIYIGADMDFGVWKKNKSRKFCYKSLYPFHTKIGDTNEEFWGTYEIRNKIIFISHQNIYTFYKNRISKISAPFRFVESFEANGRIFVTDEKNGFYEYNGNSLNFLFSYPNNTSFDISGVFLNKNLFYIITKNQGIYDFSSGKLTFLQSEISSEIIKNKVFCFTNIENKYMAFGTILNGVYITDLKGNLIQHFNKNKGFSNNTVLSMFYQKNGKLWLGLDYGLAMIDIKSNITYFQGTGNNFGTGYAAIIKDDLFYLGTNQGLYIAKWDDLGNSGDNNLFRMVSGSEGQVWTLQNINDKIICGHDKGLYEVEGEKISKIHSEPGITCMLKYTENLLLAGSYNGISIFGEKSGSWEFVKKMKTIQGAVSQIVKENDVFYWVNIPNYGFIRFTINSDLDPKNRSFYNQNDFNGRFLSLYKNKDRLGLITDSFTYSFSPEYEIFTRKSYHPQHFIQNIYSGFFLPIVLNDEYGFYSINNGFALEKFDRSRQNKQLYSKLIFRKMTAFNNDNSLDFFEDQELIYKFNNIRLNFIFPNEDDIKYQYFLDGFSKKWSNVSSKTSAEFLDLKEGDYTFIVRAQKNSQHIATKKFNFKISPPWYRTLWGYLSYIFSVGLLIYLVKNHLNKKLKKEKSELYKKQKESLEKQAEQHRQEMMLERQKQLEYEKEKLREEMRIKTIELAVKAKEGEDKSRILQMIREKISEAENNPNISKARLTEIRQMLKHYLVIEDHTFEIQMDELHQDFFKAIKKKFPNLSIYELRLCVFLKIGLSSKEIADILQVLPSSINVSRSRLRKKLKLESEDDLYEFLNKFQ